MKIKLGCRLAPIGHDSTDPQVVGCRGKKGQLGSFLAMFAAAIAIAIIFFFYSFYGMGLAKTVSDSKGGVVVYDENQVEIGNVLNYTSSDYVNLVKTRFFIEEGKSLSVALQESEYEK